MADEAEERGLTIWSMVVKEMWHRAAGTMLMVLSVAVAAGCVVGGLSFLRAHDLASREILRAKQDKTREEMARLEDSMRKAMLGLGFNIVILPKGQSLEEWHAQNFGSSTMPEEYATRLAKAKVITVQHILPCLQEKVRWPEIKRSVILVGTRGEVAGGKKPMMEAVPEGTVVLGYELHDSLGLKEGDKVTLMGREMKVGKCHAMRGNADDITVWVDLKTTQEMLGKPGVINAIQAIECECAFADLPKVREEITKILPDTQVIERGSEALARAEARRKVGEEAAASMAREEKNLAAMRGERERLAAGIGPVVIVGSGVWICVLMLMNVRRRRSEIGLLRAIGVKGRSLFAMVVAKGILIGVKGGAVGCAAGLGVAMLAGERAGFLWCYAWMAMGMAVVLAGVASWIPAVIASQQDPAEILRQESA